MSNMFKLVDLTVVEQLEVIRKRLLNNRYNYTGADDELANLAHDIEMLQAAAELTEDGYLWRN